ncbi:alpha/beta hydrolase [Pseudomonas putida]|uniref:alpha/beta hydrolase n=1 Tax=Pseudomonas putida TaxID=303 RepID=UPI00300F2AFA
MINPLKLIFRTNADGTTSASTTMSSVTAQREKEIGVPAKKVVPIVFIPGIMGTNLWNTRTKKIAWIAPNTDSILLKISALGTAISAFFSTAKDRQNDLDASDGVITVYQDGPIGSDGLINPISKEELKRRGWGGIMRSAYHPIMVQMQNEMNSIMNNGVTQDWWKTHSEHSPADWGDWKSNPSLSELNDSEGLKHCSEIRYEVWAAGYNWLQSNGDSARDIKRYIDKTVLPSYPTADRVIIVTHSMGGLVARAMVGIHEYQNILGIIHGAMPATGAPAAYRRIRAGFEGNGKPDGYLARLILGPTAADTVAVLAYSRGGLELLPSADYDDGNKWLFARREKKEKTNNQIKTEEECTEHVEFISLPTAGDPYKDIYKSDKWWGLIPRENEHLIDPNEFYKTQSTEDWAHTPSKREIFEDNISLVKIFHDGIKTAYHGSTYVHYSAEAQEEDLATWGNIVWTSDWTGWGDIPNAKITDDDMTGNIVLDAGYKFGFGPKNSPGDGTVPMVSSASSRNHRNVQAAFAHGKNSSTFPDACKNGLYNDSHGYEHQSSYNDPEGRTLFATLYSIVRISTDVKVND